MPAGHGGSSLACLRSLGRHGVRTIGVASDTSAAALRSKYCDESVVAPSPYDDLDGYADHLLSLSARPDVETVVPLYEPDIYVLAENREAFAEEVRTPWMPFEDVLLAQDRLRLCEAAAAAGVPTPETRPLDEWEDWDRRTVVKSRYALCVVDGRATYPGVRFPAPGEPPDVDRLVEEMGHVPVVQEYVPGTDEHGYFALFDRGEPVATFQHRRVRSYTYSGGASVYRESIQNWELAKAGERLLRELDWHGPAMVEFKRDERDGSFRLLEVNPRFWGSLPLAVHAGVDFPRLYYELATDSLREETDASDDDAHGTYEVGVGCHVLRGELSYLHSLLRYDYEHVDRPSVPRATASVLTSLVRQRNFDYLSTDDVRPFVRDLANLAGVRSDGSVA